ncbi:hypothetical protein V6N11_001285 [Hibiscus sabdariffa]|uniref:UBN2 domain-containing protein n=1 Tax=Hibiscus sabdariffa TaxID=183260 RepID=A0ABR2S040_9ROSI
MNRSANCNITVVGLSIPIPIFLNIALGIKLTLDPRSHNALPMKLSPIEHGIMKLLGSFFFIGLEEHAKISSCDNAKEIWEKLEVAHEGTNEVKETKISLLNLNYENFKMDPNEDIKAMFNRLSIIVNELKGFGEAIPEDKLVRKLIYSLPESWDSKKTTIIEAKNLKELKLDELIGSLLTHELMPKPLIREKEKKIKEQGHRC